MGCGFLHRIVSKIASALGCVKDATSVSSNHHSPTPRELLANRVYYEEVFFKRRVNRETDTALAALYRLYEHIILDQHLEIRNEIEAFRYRQWPVCDIPDPLDPDPDRYAVLSCIPALLCQAFNRRIELGLPRDAPSIFTRHMLDEWRAQERRYEEEPPWVTGVPRLTTTLAIPHWDRKQHDFVNLEGFDSVKASVDFAKKNILIWSPHTHFA